MINNKCKRYSKSLSLDSRSYEILDLLFFGGDDFPNHKAYNRKTWLSWKTFRPNLALYSIWHKGASDSADQITDIHTADGWTNGGDGIEGDPCCSVRIVNDITGEIFNRSDDGGISDL